MYYNHPTTVACLILSVGLALLTTQTGTAKATNEHDYKYWWVYPNGKTFPCLVPYDCGRNTDGYEWSNDPSFQFGFKQAGLAMDSCFHTPNDSDASVPQYDDDIGI
jgi:hypothetical protein